MANLCNILFASVCLFGLAHSAEIKVIVSGYGSQLDTVVFDTETAELTRVNTQDWGTAMTFLDLQGDNLYAIHEVTEYEEIENDGAISRWTLGSDDLTWERQEVT